jgi:hypothetical protein
MVLEVVRLYFNSSTHRDLLGLSIASSKNGRAVPCTRHVRQKLTDVVSVGPEQGQRQVYGSLFIRPLLGPDLLRLCPVPSERELGIVDTQRHLDARLPEIISVDDVMHDLPDRPASARTRGVQFAIPDVGESTFK